MQIRFTSTLLFLAFFIAGMQKSQAQPNDENYVFSKSGSVKFTRNSSYTYFKPVDTLLAVNHVTEFTECTNSINAKGKKVGKEKCTYKHIDEYGRTTEFSWSRGKKEYARKFYAYDKNNRVTYIQYGGDSKLGSEVFYSYNDSGSLVEYKMLKKGKIETLKRYYYSKGKRLDYSLTYQKDTIHYKYRIQSSYEGDTGRLIKSVLTDAKGKMIYTWDYSCLPYGDLKKDVLKKEKRICTSDSRLPNGHRQVVYEEMDGKSLRRYIYEYDSLARYYSILQYRGKAGESLYSKSLYNYSDSGRVSQHFYYEGKNGQLSKQYTYQYNLLDQTLSSVSQYYSSQGKLKTGWQTKYTYNGTLVQTVSGMNLLNKGNQSITEYVYQYKQ